MVQIFIKYVCYEDALHLYEIFEDFILQVSNRSNNKRGAQVPFLWTPSIKDNILKTGRSYLKTAYKKITELGMLTNFSMVIFLTYLHTESKTIRPN